MWLRNFFVFFVLLIICSNLEGSEKKTKTGISVLPVPVIGYSPETKTYLGAVSLFTIRNLKDSSTRVSNARAEFNYTWNKQLVFETGWNYFTKAEKWFSRGIVHYSKYPDLYYGIGHKTTNSDELRFQSNRLIIEFDMLRNSKKNQFFGFGLSHKHFYKFEYLGELVSFPELKTGYSYGLKVLFLDDSRDDILTSTNGKYFEVSNTVNFGSHSYIKTILDYRNYYRIANSNNHILSTRIFFHNLIGNPPFFDYALIGGDQNVRGYYKGRFRDKNVTSLQVEYRNMLFWRIGMATFGGISVVSDQRFRKTNRENLKPNAGIGLRFRVDKTQNTNLRIDYAVGINKQSGFYISFGESF
jgi:hypothetical protein